MKTCNHTKGKWEFKDYLMMHGCDPANLSPSDATYEEATANCRLIAAAPELLDVLKKIEHDLDYWKNFMADKKDGRNGAGSWNSPTLYQLEKLNYLHN